ncbi:MAG: SDR family NAD(P)-dependent oxidoreductase [Actinobacteria bacterium]|nr:SDR family NAD(P)-dependent oxidoreductase [Actinomycetota bacterium]
MKLRDTSALVTGGASGLGLATARALAAAGARVLALDLPQSIPESNDHEGVAFHAGDVTQHQQVQGAIDAAEELGQLRTVVNCAGVAPSQRIVGRGRVHDLDLFNEVVRVNLIGTFTVTALAAAAIARTEALADGARGVIVNTASIAAFDGQVGQAAYAASKAGVVGLTLPAARDLSRYGIRVCCIAPGIVETPMMATVSDEFRTALAATIPFPNRFARPEEFADLVLALVAHDYLNGETIRMDGALRMGPR